MTLQIGYDKIIFDNLRRKLLENILKKCSFIKGEVFGAIIAGIIALPQALAFGVASGFGASAGIWGAIILSFIVGIAGSKVPIISGPTAPIAIILASAFAVTSGKISDIILILVMASILQVLISLTSAPKLIKYVPYPVISGFLSGIGLIIIILQAPVLLGAVAKSSTVETIMNLSALAGSISIPTTILGVATLLLLFFTPKFISRIIPVQLFVLVVMTVVAHFLGWDIAKISTMSVSFPKFILPNFSIDLISKYFPLALTLAFVATCESLLTGVIIDSLTKHKHNSKQLIFVHGIGNLICSLTGSMGGSAATMRSVAAVKNDAKTNISAIISSLFLLIVLLKFSWFIVEIPICVLAGILIKIGLDIIDFKVLKILKFAPKDDLTVLVIVLFLTVFYNLIFAIGVGIVLSSLLYAKRVADSTVIKEKQELDTYSDYEIRIEQNSHYKIRILHLDGQFFFGSISQIVSHFDELLETKYIILTYNSNIELDMSAIFALEDIIVRLQSQNIKLFLVITNDKVREKIIEMHTITEQIGEDALFKEEKDAIDIANNHITK